LKDKSGVTQPHGSKLGDKQRPYPQQVLLGYARGNIVVVQHCRRRLDDVFGGLSGAAEAVVPRHGEVLVAAAAVLQLEHLAGDHRVLLRHTAHTHTHTHTQHSTAVSPGSTDRSPEKPTLSSQKPLLVAGC